MFSSSFSNQGPIYRHHLAWGVALFPALCRYEETFCQCDPGPSNVHEPSRPTELSQLIRLMQIRPVPGTGCNWHLVSLGNNDRLNMPCLRLSVLANTAPFRRDVTHRSQRSKCNSTLHHIACSNKDNLKTYWPEPCSTELT